MQPGASAGRSGGATSNADTPALAGVVPGAIATEALEDAEVTSGRSSHGVKSNGSRASNIRNSPSAEAWASPKNSEGKAPRTSTTAWSMRINGPSLRRSSLNSASMPFTVRTTSVQGVDAPPAPKLHAVVAKAVLEHYSVQLFMLMLTIMILFSGDVVQACADVSYDTDYANLLWACLVFFSVEYIANIVASSAQTPRYNCSLFFFLDFVATISILIDIIMIEANDLSRGGPVARAARAARIGTRAGRSLRLMRLMRFLRLVRITRMVKVLLARKMKRIANGDGSGDATPDMQRADTIGAQIGAATTKKVIIMTLMLLTMITLLQRGNEFQACSAEFVFSTEAIYKGNRIGSNCTKMQQEAGPWFRGDGGLVSFSQNPSEGLTQGGLIYAVVEGCVMYSDTNLMGTADDREQKQLAMRRRGTEVLAIPCEAAFQDLDRDVVDDRSSTYFLYDMRRESIEEALLSIAFTSVIIVSLLGFSLIFSSDAEGIANQLVVPIQQLMLDMSHTAKLELNKVTPPEELVPSSVFEVRSLQAAFHNLNAAVRSFSKFTPLEVVRHFLSLGAVAQLGVAERNVSIFFSDIAGWTTICEKTKPVEVLSLLSEYFESMVSIIIEEQGTMLEFIGDAILAVWNAPNDVPDHAVRAVTSADRMNSILSSMRESWSSSGKPEIRIRVGLHSSRVYVGNLGSNMRMKYGVLGDGVNLASRLEELNKRYKTECMISEDVLKEPGVGDAFLVRPLDAVAVKGRTKPVKVYEVLGARKDSTEEARQISTVSTQAFKAYLDQDFDEALQSLKVLEQIKGGEDYAGTVLAERCVAFKESPPPANWDGLEVANMD